MRMRKKKNLTEKLSKCTNLIEMPPVTADFRDELKIKEYINFSEYFGNNNPLQIEIGCGKGQFICEIAKRRPDINFIAVEVNRNVICDACQKAMQQNINNAVFLLCGAEVLEKYIAPGIITRMYLNFSCPFPKKSYANRRLTNRRYLEIYKNLLAPEAEIHQKTDNMHFFEYSLEQYSLAGYKIKNVSLDLHNSDFPDNIVTEYEKKFSEQGFRIYRLEAYL